MVESRCVVMLVCWNALGILGTRSIKKPSLRKGGTIAFGLKSKEGGMIQSCLPQQTFLFLSLACLPCCEHFDILTSPRTGILPFPYVVFKFYTPRAFFIFVIHKYKRRIFLFFRLWLDHQWQKEGYPKRFLYFASLFIPRVPEMLRASQFSGIATNINATISLCDLQADITEIFIWNTPITKNKYLNIYLNTSKTKQA